MKQLLAIANRTWPEEIFVEPCRLEMGIWGNREGDIAAAYSADKFPKIKTFVHDGQLFTNCGGCAEESMGCYPLIPESDYRGPEPRQYTYEGRTVTYRGGKFKLGPKVKFTVRERTVEEWTDLLRRQYAHGGYFAAGKTYKRVLRNFRQETRRVTSRNEVIAIELELRTNDQPHTQTEMLARLAKSYVTSTSHGSQMELRFSESLALPDIASETASECTKKFTMVNPSYA